MEKFRTMVGTKKEETEPATTAQTSARPEPREEAAAIQEIVAATAREATDVGQFMRYVASTIAKLPPEERTFVRFLIAPKATPLVINDRMIEVIYKNIDLLEEPHIEALSKSMSPEDLVKLADRFNNKLAALVAIFAEKCRPATTS